MQEKSNEQISMFIRDDITGHHLFNPKALVALGINPADAQERGFQISLKASATPIQHGAFPSRGVDAG